MADAPDLPAYGYVVRRRDLDTIVADTRWTGRRCSRVTRRCSHRRPWFRRGAVVQPTTGAPVESAPGTSSSPTAPTPLRAFGRHRPRPRVAIRHRDPHLLGDAPPRDPWIESALDVKDRNGNSMPGYGWIFPVGDGTVNIGVGLLSTFREFKSVNTTHLMDAFATRGPRDGDRPRPPECGRPAGGADGISVIRTPGPTLVIGDAAGTREPFNGEGIDYAYETGRMAAAGAARGPGRRRSDGAAALPEDCSTTSTASTSRSPGCSPGSSAGRR